MGISPLAGKPAPKELLVDVARLEREYFERKPDLGDPNQLVSFGTSGHRGSPLHGSFTETHILAITQAICDYRRGQGTGGPLYMGKDTHALSGPAERTALEVLAANGAQTVIQRDDGVTPTPVISRAIQVVGETSTFGPDLVGTAARRHIRRQGRPQGVRAYRFDGWELNLNTRRLTAPDGRPVELSRGEFNLLVVLLGAPPRILGRDQLFDLSRLHNDEVYNRSIDVQILRLRRKIERDPAAPRYVRTERGVGYVFSAPVETLY